MKVTAVKRILTTGVLIILLVQIGNLKAQSINVVDFGADPTGTKENSKITNMLIDSLSAAGGGEIIIPKGTYLLNDAILLKSNITFKGAGIDETTFFRDPKQGNWSATKAQALISTSPENLNTNITVSNLEIDAEYNKNEEKAKGGICLRNCQNSTISNIRTLHTWHGIAFYDFKGDDSNNLIKDSHAIKAQAFTSKNNSGRPRGILVTDNGSKVINSISTKAGTGFYAHGKNISFEKCKAESWFTDNGYYLIVEHLTVKNCIAVGGPSSKEGFGSGFSIAYKKDGLIQDSEAINCSNYGFRIHVPQSDTKFVNNTAIGCGIGFGIETASHPFPELSDQIQLINNTAETSGLTSFLFRQMSNSTVTGNKAINGNQRGVTLSTRGAFALKDYLTNNTFSENESIDNQKNKTQIFGFYDYSVDQIKSSSKKGKNNKISHKSKNGKDVF
tara:strand:+ start:1931 stop:3268 length:1338 start_codon:yes stop_codon:yes gene_type:complete